MLKAEGKERAVVVGDGSCQYGSLLESARHKGMFVGNHVLEPSTRSFRTTGAFTTTSWTRVVRNGRAEFYKMGSGG